MILIAVGVAFLLRNIGFDLPHNWWALLLLIPALGAFGNAWRAWAYYGELRGPAIGSLLGGLILLGLTVIFFYDIQVDWDLLWPGLLILLGVVLLFRSYRRF